MNIITLLQVSLFCFFNGERTSQLITERSEHRFKPHCLTWFPGLFFGCSFPYWPLDGSIASYKMSAALKLSILPVIPVNIITFFQLLFRFVQNLSVASSIWPGFCHFGINSLINEEFLSFVNSDWFCFRLEALGGHVTFCLQEVATRPASDTRSAAPWHERAAN